MLKEKNAKQKQQDKTNPKIQNTNNSNNKRKRKSVIFSTSFYLRRKCPGNENWCVGWREGNYLCKNRFLNETKNDRSLNTKIGIFLSASGEIRRKVGDGRLLAGNEDDIVSSLILTNFPFAISSSFLLGCRTLCHRIILSVVQQSNQPANRLTCNRTKQPTK